MQNAFGGNLEALGSLITDKLDNAVSSFNKRFDEFEVVEPDTEEQTVSPIPADAPLDSLGRHQGYNRTWSWCAAIIWDPVAPQAQGAHPLGPHARPKHCKCPGR